VNRPGAVRSPAPLLLAIVLLLAAGCGQALRSLPPQGLTAHREIVVFSDGFHSGLLLPWPDPALAALDPATGDGPASLPWFEVGFGAAAWMLEAQPGCCTATGMVVCPVPGALAMRHHRDPAPLPRSGAATRTWRLTVDADGWTALAAALRADRGPGEPRLPGNPALLCSSPRRWSVLANCHDWTVSRLRDAGLDLRDRTWRGNRDLVGDLDRAVVELAAAGRLVVGRE
jgi:hypothetical protein